MKGPPGPTMTKDLTWTTSKTFKEKYLVWRTSSEQAGSRTWCVGPPRIQCAKPLRTHQDLQGSLRINQDLLELIKTRNLVCRASEDLPGPIKTRTLSVGPPRTSQDSFKRRTLCAGPPMTSQDPPGPIRTKELVCRTSQDILRPTRTSQDLPGLTRTSQDYSGPPRTSQDPSWSRIWCLRIDQ